MSCGCKDDFLPFNTRVQRAFVDSAWDFYPDTPCMPFCPRALAAIRMLAEQNDGLEVRMAYQTATVRFDQAATLNDWTLAGTTRTTEGDHGPEAVSPTGQGSAFWIRFGHAIRRSSGANGIGVASVGMQWSLPTDRPRLVLPPTVVNAYDNPVSGVQVELMTTEWTSYDDLQAVSIAYQAFNADADFRYTVVLQAVPFDPSQDSPTEDTLVPNQTGNSAGVARVTSGTFTNADAIDAQLFRIVLKADNNGAGTDKRARVYVSASAEYA